MPFKPKNLYLLLAILGFLVPNYFLFQIMREHQGFDVVRFWNEITINNSMRFINSDLSITGLAFLAFLIIDSRINQVRLWWLGILGTVLVGISFGFPLYLYLRERKFED